jgi:hypothetical protein
MPERIQRKRTKGFRLPPRTLCVTRPGVFGNPYPVSEYGREMALTLFDAYLDTLPPALLRMRLAQVREAAYIACFCRLDETCHGDIWMARAMREVPPA